MSYPFNNGNTCGRTSVIEESLIVNEEQGTDNSGDEDELLYEVCDLYFYCSCFGLLTL